MRLTKLFAVLALLMSINSLSKTQHPTIAVFNMDVQGLNYTPEGMGNLLRLEVEKTGKHSVLDRYDLSYVLEKENLSLSNCYGRICLLEAGKVLNADKVLSGSIERFDNKIVLVLRLVDVHTEKVEKTNIMEYLDLPEIQRMIEISVNNIFEIENDPNIVSQLANYDNPISTPKTQLTLSGPRMGISFIGGLNGQILQKSASEGGFDMMPYSTLIGYQHEISYLSSGNFQALIEVITLVGGMEQGRFVPSVTLMNGLRSNKSGFEIAFGPQFELVRMSSGYYDENNNWHLEHEMHAEPEPFEVEDRLDSRGDIFMTTAWVFAVGKTFRSGYLNIPVNAYFSPKKNGWVAGCSFGFNISRLN